MGKLLIIKDADFSQVAVDVVQRADYEVKSLLRSDGVAYIDTMVVLTGNDVLIVDGYLDGTGISASQFLFGWRNTGSSSSTNGNSQVMLVKQPTVSYLRVFVGGQSGSTVSVNDATQGVEHSFKWDFVNSRAYIDNVQYTSSPQVSFPNALGSISLMLFCCNNAGVSLNPVSSTQYIKSCKIIRNGETILDLIPCIYNETHGMWDRVSNTFVGPSSGGTFTAE